MNTKQIVTGLARGVVKVAVAAIVIFLIYKYAVRFYDFGKNVFGAPAMEEGEGTEVTVAIVEGKSVKEIGRILQDKGLIKDARLFYFQELLSGEHGKLKPGIYTLNTNMTPKEIIQTLAAGNEADLYGGGEDGDWGGSSPVGYDADDEPEDGDTNGEE